MNESHKDIMKKNWQNPEQRAKMIAGMKSPATKAKHAATKLARKAGAAILAPTPVVIETPAPALAPVERPEWLSTKALRDYAIGIRKRMFWVPLGAHYAPKFLLGQFRQAVCDIYGVRMPRSTPPDDIPEEMRELNERFFTSEKHGLGVCSNYLWESAQLSTLAYPTLWQVSASAYMRDILRHQTIGDTPLAAYYWSHKEQRKSFERIVIVPRGRKL